MRTPYLNSLGILWNRGPISQIQPFTQEDGVAYLQILYGLRDYVRKLAEDVNGISDEVDKALEEVAEQVDEALAAQDEKTDEKIAEMVTYVNNAVQSIINNSIELQDAVLAGILTDSDSDSSTAIDLRWLGINDRTRYLRADSGDNITTALNDMIASAPAGSYTKAALMPGEYLISDTISLNLSRAGLFGLFDGVVLRAAEDFPTDGRPMIDVWRETRDAFDTTIPRAPGDNVLNNVTLVGPGRATNSVAVHISNDSDDPVRPLANFGIQSVSVVRFGTGFQLGTNAFNIKWLSCFIYQCGIGVEALAGATDFGSLMSFVSCSIYNCSTGLMNNSNVGRFHFVTTGFDGCTQAINNVGPKIDLIACHLEAPMYREDLRPWIHMRQGSLMWIGGDLAGSDRNGPQNAVIIQNDAVAKGALTMVRDVLFTGSFRSNQYPFSDGPGATIVETMQGGIGNFQSKSSAWANHFANGDAELAAICDDMLIIGGTGALVDDTLEYGNDSIKIRRVTNHTKNGTGSYRVNTTGNANASLYIMAWAKPGSIHQTIGSVSRLSGMNGTFYIQMGWGKVRNGKLVRSVQSTERAINDAYVENGAWALFADAQANRVPSWANVVFIRLRCNNTSELYLDDLWTGTI